MELWGSHFRCKVTNKWLNVQRGIKNIPLFPCCCVNHQCLWKETWKKKNCRKLTFCRKWWAFCRRSGEAGFCGGFTLNSQENTHWCFNTHKAPPYFSNAIGLYVIGLRHIKEQVCGFLGKRLIILLKPFRRAVVVNF